MRKIMMIKNTKNHDMEKKFKKVVVGATLTEQG
jgi:hypothetical protein